MDSEKASNRITSSDKFAKVFSDALKTRATTTLHRAEPQVDSCEAQIDVAIIEESEELGYKHKRSIPSPKKYANRVLNFEENYSSEMEENRSGFQSMINKVPQLESSLYFSYRHSNFVSPSDSFLSSERSEYWALMKAADLSSNFDLQRELDAASPGAVVFLPNREFEVSGLVIRKPVTLQGLKNTRLVIADPVLILTGEKAPVSVMNVLIDSNSFGKNCSSTFRNVHLFVVEASAELHFRDCRIEGCRNLTLVSAERLQCLTLESCHVKSLRQVGVHHAKFLRVHNCFFEQFSSRVLELGSLQEATIEETTFLDNVQGCIKLEYRDSPNGSKFFVTRCHFANNPGTPIEVKGPGPLGSELTVGISGCSFKDSPANQVSIAHAVFNACCIDDCRFEKITGKCISLNQARNFSVSKCEFKTFEDEAISVAGGNGRVDNCSMTNGEFGIRLIGDGPFQPLQPKETGANSSRKTAALVNPTFQVSRTMFSGMRQAGVEVSDTHQLEFRMEACSIQKGVIGILIRDVQQELRLDTSTAHGEPRFDIQANFVDHRTPNGNSTFEQGRLLLIDNIISNNLGSGVKIETPSTPVIIEGGQIFGNRDHSIGVIGSRHKHLVFGTGTRQPKLDRQVEEIDFGLAQTKTNPCTLI